MLLFFCVDSSNFYSYIAQKNKKITGCQDADDCRSHASLGYRQRGQLENYRGQTDRVTTPTRAGLCRWHRLRHAARLAALARCC